MGHCGLIVVCGGGDEPLSARSRVAQISDLLRTTSTGMTIQYHPDPRTSHILPGLFLITRLRAVRWVLISKGTSWYRPDPSLDWEYSLPNDYLAGSSDDGHGRLGPLRTLRRRGPTRIHAEGTIRHKKGRYVQTRPAAPHRATIYISFFMSHLDERRIHHFALEVGHLDNTEFTIPKPSRTSDKR